MKLKKTNIEKKEILALVGREFNYPMDFKFTEIVVHIIEMVLDNEKVEDDPMEAILEEIDCYLIWNDDQWTVMKFYQYPNEANFTNAMETLMQDIYNIVIKLLEVKENA